MKNTRSGFRHGISVYACVLSLRREVMTMPATDPKSRRMRVIELAVEIFFPTAYDSGSKRMMSWPSPSGMTASRSRSCPKFLIDRL